ncbi:MAG: M56 family metallopeptidase/LCP family protein [Armatimonadota bacterium]
MTTLIADMALAVTVVLGLGSIAALVLWRGSPALRHAAWRATLAGVWLAPLAVIAAGMLPVQRPEIAVPVPRYAPAPAPVAEAPAAPVAEPMARTPEVAPAAESAPAPREPLPIAAILLSLWAVGALVALVAFGRDATALRTLLAEGAPTDRPATVEAIAQRLGLARLPRVRRSPEVSMPAVAGWLRPTLVLPSEARPDEAALIHELAHVQRGDVPALAAARLTAAVWWWHPLAWLVLRGLAATAEEACDDVVLALSGARREYAQMLTDWAERATVAGAVNCGSRGRALIARVRRVLDERMRPVVALSGGARVAVIACALIAVLAAGAFGLRAVAPDADGITTVLLIGNDARPNVDFSGRADTIMLLFVNPETDRAALLSLPRDLRVEIPGRGLDKLGHAYVFGGSALVQQTVEGLLGITIDHHVTLDMARFPEVIDALGPVMIDVPDVEGRGRGMNYDDNWGDLHIHLQPGPQLLNGEQALGFVTYRWRDSDAARQKRQQQFLQALIDQRLSGANVPLIVQVMPRLLDAVETDMSLREAVDLTRVIHEMPSDALLTTDLTAHLRDLMVGGVYYVEIERRDLVSVLAEVAGHLGATFSARLVPDDPGFSLEFYLGTEVQVVPELEDWRWEAMDQTDEDSRLFRYLDQNRKRYFRTPLQPAFTEEDIAGVERMVAHEAEGARPPGETDTLSFEMKDREAFRAWTGAHVGEVVLFVLIGEPVMAPVIRSAIPGTGVMEGLTPEQIEAVMGYFGE